MIFIQYNKCQSISYELNYSYELIKSHYIIVSIRNNRLTKIVRFFFIYIIMNSIIFNLEEIDDHELLYTSNAMYHVHLESKS